MAIVENAVVLAIGLLELVQRLGDQEGAHAVAGHEGQAGLEEVEPSERRKLVEHHEELMLGRPARLFGVELFGESAADLVEDQADQRLGPADVGGRSEEHTSELQSLMRISYAVFCLKKKINVINARYTKEYTHTTMRAQSTKTQVDYSL